MGNSQGLGLPEKQSGKKKEGKKNDQANEKPRGPPPPTHGRKKRKSKGMSGAVKMPLGS